MENLQVVMEYSDWVKVIANTGDGLYFIENQYRNRLDRVNYGLCSDCVEVNEKPLEAAQRELIKETKFEGCKWTKILTSSPNPNSMDNICQTSIVNGLNKASEPHREIKEDIQVHLLTFDELKQALTDDIILEGIMPTQCINT